MSRQGAKAQRFALRSSLAPRVNTLPFESAVALQDNA